MMIVYSSICCVAIVLSYNFGKCQKYYFHILAQSLMLDVTHVQRNLGRENFFDICPVGIFCLCQHAVLVNVFNGCIIRYSRPNS